MKFRENEGQLMNEGDNSGIDLKGCEFLNVFFALVFIAKG